MAVWAKDKKAKREIEDREAKHKAAEAFKVEFLSHSRFRVIPNAYGKCAICANRFDPGLELKDATARLEYMISLMCQKCQDQMFAPRSG